MARYTGPRDKVSRRFGVALFGSTKALEKRPFPPGQHGMRAGRKKKSDYGVMLAENRSCVSSTVCLKASSASIMQKPPAAAALPAIFCFSSLSFVWTMLCTASVSATPAPEPVSSFPTATSP